MRKMKDSGIEWIGEIPEDWDVHRLAGLGEFSGSGNDKKINPDEPTVKMINYVDVYNNKTYELNANIDYMTVSCPENKYSELLVQKGDLIFTPSSETIDDIGISALVVDDLKNTVYSYHVLRYRATEKVDFSFKKYLCNNHYARNYFSSKAVGTVRKTLNRDDFKNLKIALPPIEAQAKIAIYLDKKCAVIDAIIAAKEKTNELLKERRQSIIYEAVTKGLDPTVPMKDSGIEWIGMIPERWNCKKIKYAFSLVAGATPKSGNEEYWDGDIIWITPADYTTEDIYIYEGHKTITTEGLNSCATTMIPEESIVFSKRAPIGLVAINKVPLCTNQGCISCIPKEDVDSKFYYYVMSAFTKEFDLFGSGTTFKEISAEAFANFILPNTSIDEQKEIAEYLDLKCTEINDLISSNNSTIEKLKEYRQSVIYEAVTGKVEI